MRMSRVAGRAGRGIFEDGRRFCGPAALGEAREHSHRLTHGRIVGAAANEEKDALFRGQL